MQSLETSGEQPPLTRTQTPDELRGRFLGSKVPYDSATQWYRTRDGYGLPLGR